MTNDWLSQDVCESQSQSFSKQLIFSNKNKSRYVLHLVYFKYKNASTFFFCKLHVKC